MSETVQGYQEGIYGLGGVSEQSLRGNSRLPTLSESFGSFAVAECWRVLAKLSISSMNTQRKVSSSSSTDSIVLNNLLTVLPLSLKYLLKRVCASNSTSLQLGKTLPSRIESCWAKARHRELYSIRVSSLILDGELRDVFPVPGGPKSKMMRDQLTFN